MKHRSAHSTTLVGTVSSRLVWHESFGFVPWLKATGQPARGGCTRGRQPSCGGSRQHRCLPAPFAGEQRASGVGGTIPAPALPLGGNGKGGSNSLLPQANSGDVELRSNART